MRYYLQITLTPKNNYISPIIRDSQEDHKILNDVSTSIFFLKYEKAVNNCIQSIENVLSSKSEVEHIGQDDVVGEVRRDFTVITNDNFEPSTEDTIPTQELKRLIEEWWNAYQKIKNIF